METSSIHRIYYGNSLRVTFIRRQILRIAFLLVCAGGAHSQEPDPLLNHAEVYVDQYFEPTPRQKLSERGKEKSSALGHFAIGRLQENKGQVEKAIASYSKVLEVETGNIDLSRKTARMLAQAGRQKQAKQLLEDSLLNNSDKPLPYIVLSEFLSSYHGNNQDNKDRSLELAKQAVKNFPKEALAYEHLSKMYMLGKRRAEAQKLLLNALKVKSEDPVFWLRLGKSGGRVWPIRLNGEENTSQLAILNKYYERAGQLAGDDDEVRLRSADFYASTQQYDKAEKIYSVVSKRLTGRLDIRKKLASIYDQREDTDNYIKVLDSVIQVDPGDVESHHGLAEAYRSKKQIGLAIKHHKIALKLGKGSAAEYLALGGEMEDHALNLSREGKKEEAKKLREDTVKFVREAAYLFPEDPKFHLLVHYPLRNLKRNKEALKHLQKYEEIAKKESPELLDSEFFYFDYASVSEQTGDIKAATQLFQKCLEIIRLRNPQHSNDRSKKFAAQVYNYLGYMWLENDMHIHQAGSHIERAAELDPNSAAIADSLGWYYFKVDRFEDALNELLRSEKLLAKDPDFINPDPVILDHIGQTYHKLGKHGEAIKYMEKTIKYDEEDKQEYKDRLKEYRKIKQRAEKEALSEKGKSDKEN